MKNNNPELTPTTAAAKDYENNPAKYATTPAEKLDRHEMLFAGSGEPYSPPKGRNPIDEANAPMLPGEKVIVEAGLREILLREALVASNALLREVITGKHPGSKELTLCHRRIALNEEALSA